MQIHPSVIMSISEHHTRARASRQKPEIVIGALLGIKNEHKIEIMDSFELRLTREDYNPDYQSLIIDREFYQKKVPLVKQVSADLDLIGWYSTTPPSVNFDTLAAYISLHRQISEFIPNPLFLRLNPYKREKDPKISGVLPIELFEPVIGIDSDEEKLDFIEVAWSIVTEDIEIIGLEHDAKVSDIDAAPSAAIDNLRLQYSAVKMLKDRIKVISKFVKDVQSGVLKSNEELLNDISRLSQKFPLMNSDQYRQAYNIQCNDVALNTYLGILTKGSMCKIHFGVPNLKPRAYSTTHARR